MNSYQLQTLPYLIDQLPFQVEQMHHLSSHSLVN